MMDENEKKYINECVESKDLPYIPKMFTDLYNEDELGGTKTSKNDMGSAETMYGYIWLNAEEHKKRPVSELLNTIIHELIHIKYPDMSEENVVLETNKYVPIQKD